MAYEKLRSDRLLTAHRTGTGLKLLTGTPSDSLAQSVPLLYDASGNVLSTATRTGNTTNYATATAGAKTSANYPKWDANGNLTDGDAGGGGTVIGGGGVFSGTLAAIPSPTEEGQLYKCTDSPYEYMCSGGSPLSWDLAWAFGNPVTEPVLADWTWLNQDTATAVSTYGGIYMYAPAAAGFNVRGLIKSAPATPYTLTICVQRNVASVQYPLTGLLFRKNSNGYMHYFCCYESNTVSVVTSGKLTDYSGGGDTGYASMNVGAKRIIWLRISDNGTNRVCSFSTDGITYHTIHTVGRTDFLTADEIGLFVSSRNDTYNLGAHFFHSIIT